MQTISGHTMADEYSKALNTLKTQREFHERKLREIDTAIKMATQAQNALSVVLEGSNLLPLDYKPIGLKEGILKALEDGNYKENAVIVKYLKAIPNRTYEVTNITQSCHNTLGRMEGKEVERSGKLWRKKQ